MNARLALILICFTALLPSCTAERWHKAFNSHLMTLSYDDFGPERIASQLLGPRGAHTTVIARHGATRITPSGPDGVRYLKVEPGMFFLRNQVRALPLTTANEPLRQRLRSTYARLYVLHRNYYDAMLATSFSSPQYGMNLRMLLPPAMPPSI